MNATAGGNQVGNMGLRLVTIPHPNGPVVFFSSHYRPDTFILLLGRGQTGGVDNGLIDGALRML